MTDRLPPGQILTQKWPVLHYGNVPSVDTTKWTFMVSGLVDKPFSAASLLGKVSEALDRS